MGVLIGKAEATEVNETTYFKKEMTQETELYLHTHLLTYLLTPCSRVLHEKLIGSQPVKKFPVFMEPEGSLLHLQVPTTCPYPQPGQSSPCPPIPLPEDPS